MHPKAVPGLPATSSACIDYWRQPGKSLKAIYVNSFEGGFQCESWLTGCLHEQADVSTEQAVKNEKLANRLVLQISLEPTVLSCKIEFQETRKAIFLLLTVTEPFLRTLNSSWTLFTFSNIWFKHFMNIRDLQSSEFNLTPGKILRI